MTTRRSFLKTAAVASAGLLAAPKIFANGIGSSFFSHKIGTQLYTVRELMAQDPIGTLEKVAKIGFKTVEGATYTGTELFYGMPVPQFKKVLDDTGLDMVSGHYLLGESMPNVKGTITNNWEKAVEDAAAVG